MLAVGVEGNDVLGSVKEGEVDTGLQGRPLPAVDGVSKDVRCGASGDFGRAVG